MCNAAPMEGGGPSQAERKTNEMIFTSQATMRSRAFRSSADSARGSGTEAIGFARTCACHLGLKGVSLTTMDSEAGNAVPFY